MQFEPFMIEKKKNLESNFFIALRCKKEKKKKVRSYWKTFKM